MSERKKRMSKAEKAERTIDAIVNFNEKPKIDPALTKAGLAKNVNKALKNAPSTNEFRDAAYKRGFTPQKIIDMLIECCDVTTKKWDKNGNMHEVEDTKSKLEALKIINVLADFAPKKAATAGGSKHLHLHKMSDAELDALLVGEN